MRTELPKDRPLVAMAVICENVLQGNDGTISAIRVIDRFLIPKNAPPGLAMPINLIFSFKSGDYVGSFEATFRLRRPSGAVTEIPQRFATDFKGGHSGVNFLTTITLALRERGLHYLDALRGGEVIASIPFMLEDAPEQAPPEAPGQGV